MRVPPARAISRLQKRLGVELLESRCLLAIQPAAEVSLDTSQASSPVAPWQGFADSSAALATDVYTFGSPGPGNINYYDGDFGDFDNDGLMDRALISRYGLLWNQGGGLMSPVAGRERIGEAARPNPTGFIFREAPDNTIGGLGDDGINFADVDNDRDLDVVSGGNGEVFAIQENIRGRYRVKSLNLNSGQYVSAWQIVNTDLESDGDVDLIVGSGYPVDYSVLVNDGTGAFTDQTAARGLNYSADPPEGTVSGDVDGDGDYDLVLLKGDNRTTPELGVIVAKNNASGFFTTSFAPFAKTFPNLPDIRTNSDSNQAMSLGDIDDDGDLDLFISLGLFFTDHNMLNQTIGSDPIVSHAIFVNDGSGNFVEDSAARFVGNYSGEILRGDNGELVDVDYDNDLDIVALRRDSGDDLKHFQVFINDGTGHFTYDASHSLFFPATAEAGFGNDLDMTDLDGDGTYDAWVGMAGDRVRILLNTYQNESRLPADMPRNSALVAANPTGVTLSWQAPDFAATARYYKVYRSTSPGLALTERQLLKVVGEVHQDEAFAAPITRWTTTGYLNDPDVVLNGASNEIRFTDRTAQPGLTYYYSIVHVGTENDASRPTPEISAAVPAASGVDSIPPFLFVSKPAADEWGQFPEIVLQYGDGGSGIDLSSLNVTLSVPIGAFEQQTLIPLGSTWRYLDNGSNQQTAWRALNFVDTSWNSGPAKLGYGNGNDVTRVSYGPDANAKFVTTYFRRQFNIDDLSQLAGDLTLRLRRDDGAIVYVNGVRIGATNVDPAASYNTYAASEIAEANENDFVVFQVDRDLLTNGANQIAVEVHQFNHAGLDLGFDLELTGIVASTGLPAGTNLSDLFLYKDKKVFIAPFEDDMALPLGPVTLTVSIADLAGNVSVAQKSFIVSVAANELPSAAIVVDQEDGSPMIALSAAGSDDGDGTVMRYEWYFPDGTTALDKDATWLAPGPGVYEVEVYVWDDRGGVAEAEVDITVAGDSTPTPPTVLATTPVAIHTGGSTNATISQILVDFSEPINVIDANAPANYDLRSPGLNQMFGDGDDVVLSVSPSYVMGAMQVNLVISEGPLADGVYRFTISGDTSIHDLSGIKLDGNYDTVAGGDYIRIFTVDRTPPTADIADVTPDPRDTAIDSINIVFSEPITDFELEDLSLTRNGGANLLTGSQTLISSNNIIWTLGNLAGLTDQLGSYRLTLTAADVTDVTGNPLVASISDSFILALPGDTDLDGDVDFDDAFTLINNYGITSGATWSMGDFDHDGDVDFDDAFVQINNYGATAPSVALQNSMVQVLSASASFEQEVGLASELELGALNEFSSKSELLADSVSAVLSNEPMIAVGETYVNESGRQVSNIAESVSISLALAIDQTAQFPAPSATLAKEVRHEEGIASVAGSSHDAVLSQRGVTASINSSNPPATRLRARRANSSSSTDWSRNVDSAMEIWDEHSIKVEG